MKRRFFATFLAFCMTLTLLPEVVLADNSEDLLSQAGQDVYTVEPDTQLIEPAQDSIVEQAGISTRAKSSTDVAYAVTGGNIYFDKSSGTITDCDDTVTTAVIPSVIDGVSVTSIGGYAFHYCSSLTSVSIPDSVTFIGPDAFEYCSGLTSVTIPDSVNTIENGAFLGCSGLTSVTIPDSVTFIGEYVFYCCSGLTSVTIPDSVTSIGLFAFSGCNGLTSVTIPDSITSIKGVFNGCSNLTDVYYAGTKAQWNEIISAGGIKALAQATIHYNSIGPDGPTPTPGTASSYVAFLRAYDSATRSLAFGSNEVLIYTMSATADVSGIEQLVGKYVLVTMKPNGFWEVDSIQPVESKIGTVSASGEHSVTIDGVVYPIKENFIVPKPDKEGILYHLYNGTIVGFSILEKKTGSLESWNGDTGIAVIDGREYYTNYLSDLSNLTNAGEAMGKKVEFLLASATNYNLILSLVFCPGFRVTSNAATSSVMRGNVFDLYVGYYLADGSLDTSTMQYTAAVSDGEVLAVDPTGWDEKYGQRFTVLAKNIGAASITFTHPLNGESAEIDLQVIDKEAGYRFSNVPKLTIEPGKTTNFYNYNGLVVDDFAYTAVRGPDGEVDHYDVTMTVYNTLNLYGAVIAYNAQGEQTKFQLIKKKADTPSGLTDSIEDLIEETGDLFYLIGNESYYSGKSISQDTKVSIDVPAGGYIKISNSGDSEVVLCANIVGLIIEGLIKGGKLAESASKLDGLISNKEIIISDVVKDYLENVGETALQEAASVLKSGQWTLDNYGVCLWAFLEQLKKSGPDMVDAILKELNSQPGIASLTESIVMAVIPTGNLIKFLYSAMGLGDQIVAYVDFWKCFTFSKGIYIYTPALASNNFYNSNGVTITPSTSVDSNVVIHSYIVADKNEVPNKEFSKNSETYSITMYKDGKEFQPDSTVTVRIPLPERFKVLDKSAIKVYRHNDDGTMTDMNATVIDGHAVFETNHLSYYSIVAGGSSPDPVTYTITFDANDGTSVFTKSTTDMNGKLSVLPTPVRANYAFTGWFTASNDGTQISTSYVFSSDTTVYAHWIYNESDSGGGGGGGGSSGFSNSRYNVSIGSASHGKVTTSPSSAAKGEKVTLTVKPDSGYELDSLMAADKKGNPVELKKVSDTEYTFIMPSGKVTVTPVFKKIQPIPETPQSTFTDVPADAYYYDAVRWAVERGITKGTGADAFSPDAACTRAQIVTFLWRAAGSPVPQNAQHSFNDVSYNAYYHDAVLWAAEQGITAGTGSSAFSPDRICTRSQAVTFLHRAAGTPAAGSTRFFSDVDGKAYYANAVQWAAEQNITAGTGGNAFSPDGICTRAQIVTFLYRANS